MDKKVIYSDNAPKAVGPYSQAVASGGFVFTAGQLGIDPATGQFAGTDAESQAKQVLKNLSALLEQAGASFDNVVKTTMFLVNLADFAKVNEAYSQHFKDNFPARTTIQVAALPLGAQVEIEMIARLPE